MFFLQFEDAVKNGGLDMELDSFVEPYEAVHGSMVLEEITDDQLSILRNADDPACCWEWQKTEN